MSTAPHPSRPNSPTRLPRSLTLQDLTDDLLWPKLLKVGSLALRPQRVVLAFIFIIGVVLIAGFADWADGNPKENVLATTIQTMATSGAAAGVRVAGEPAGERLATQIHDIFIGQPRLLLFEAPGVALFAVPLLFFWIALCGGAISRSAACDIAQGVSLSWPQTVGFALSRCVSLFSALFVPLLIVWAIAFGLTLAGWALFSFNVVNMLGGLLWFLFLVGGVIAAVVSIAYLFGAPLLVPSVACEGTDAIDAVQHAYSFVFARPLRLVVYLVILILQAALLIGLVGAIAWLAVHIAQSAATHWSGERGPEVLGKLPGHTLDQFSLQSSRELSGASALARGLATLWTLIPVTLPLAVGVSFFWSGSTVLYLIMRRLVDGQEISEIWMPGLIPGTMAPVATPTAATKTAASQGVSDTGPADET